jgi:hypothetical protein
MGLFAVSLGDNVNRFEVLSTTNFDSNTATLLVLTNNGGILKITLPTGDGPTSTSIDLGSELFDLLPITTNVKDNTISRFAFSQNNQEVQKLSSQTGNRPSSIIVHRSNQESSTIFTANTGDNTISKIYYDTNTQNYVSTILARTDQSPIALTREGNDLIWLNYDSNTAQTCDFTSTDPNNSCTNPVTAFGDFKDLPWADVLGESLLDSGFPKQSTQIHPVDIQIIPNSPVAFVLFEVSGFETPMKQYIVEFYPGSQPLILGPFDSPNLEPGGKRLAFTEDHGLFLLTAGNEITQVVFGNDGVNYEYSTIATEDGTVAIVSDQSGGIFTANSRTNTVSEYRPISDQSDIYGLLETYSMAPSFTLSSNSEVATAGSPVSGYHVRVVNGTDYQYSINPSIENGLSFDTSTGEISGTPIAAASAVTYTISGTSFQDAFVGYYTGVTYTISVNAAPSPREAPAPRSPAINPVQQSQITGISTLPSSGGATRVTISGSFVEKIQGIEMSLSDSPGFSSRLAPGSWTQTPTTITFSVPEGTIGNFQVSLYNGAAPALQSQKFSIAEVKLASRPIESNIASKDEQSKTQTETAVPAKSQTKTKIVSIKCVRGKLIKYIKAAKPKCPKGYIKK